MTYTDCFETTTAYAAESLDAADAADFVRAIALVWYTIGCPIDGTGWTIRGYRLARMDEDTVIVFDNKTLRILGTVDIAGVQG